MNANPSLSKLVAIVSSTCMVVALLIGMYVALWPVDVLQDWSISVQHKQGQDASQMPEYSAGEVLVLESRYRKVAAWSGQSYRYLECRHGKAWTRYPLAQTQANRAPSQTPQATGVLVELPNSLPNLPLTCRITISIDYEIYSFRKFNEYNVSNTFMLLPQNR